MANRNKPHKGLLKRVRITKSGKLKFQRPGGRHLRSNKNGEQVRKLRSPGYFSDEDVKRLSPLLAGHYKPAKPQRATKAEHDKS